MYDLSVWVKTYLCLCLYFFVQMYACVCICELVSIRLALKREIQVINSRYLYKVFVLRRDICTRCSSLISYAEQVR
jgi:hypothetical protein